MKAEEILRLREGLGFSQDKLASLLGCSWVTVSKWERGVSSPTPFQRALMAAFDRSLARDPSIGERVAPMLLDRGIPASLFELLRPGFVPAD